MRLFHPENSKIEFETEKPVEKTYSAQKEWKNNEKTKEKMMKKQ